MIKLTDLARLESIKEAQKNVGAYKNYLHDVLKPAIERGNWDEFELLDIGFSITGKSLGKVGDNEAWKTLQDFFDPNSKAKKTLDFTLNGKVIERNLRNQLKSLALKMMWISPQDHSFNTIYKTVTNIKKIIPYIIQSGYNSFACINSELVETLILTGSTNINFKQNSIYEGLNKLFTEEIGLPFHVAIEERLSASSFKLALLEPEQHTVIPQRIYYLGLQKSEELIYKLYPIKDELADLGEYIATYYDKLYLKYAKYLSSNDSKLLNGKVRWYLGKSNKAARKRTGIFQEEFLLMDSPKKSGITALLKIHKPEFKTDSIHRFSPTLTLTSLGKKITGINEAQSLFKELNGGCLWGLMSRSGLRADELHRLNTTQGCTTEVISKQTIYIIHTELSKTVKGIQSKQDEFVTTEVGKKAYEILNELHKPLRKRHPESTEFFHKVTDDCSAINKKDLNRHSQGWFNDILSEELNLTNEDIIDLKISDPKQAFNLDEKYYFTGHQLRRSFAYYLVGYELLSFPQLKQQFSHVSLAMTRHYAKNASKFQKFRKHKQNLANAYDEEKILQKAKIYLKIYKKLANKERVAGGKGKEFAKNMSKEPRNLFKDKVNNDMLSLNYWIKQIREQKRHIHAVAPGVYCTSTACSLRTQVNLMECVDCKNDFIVDAVFAEAKRKEAEINMLWDIEHDELTPRTASEAYIKITAAERIMSDLNFDYEPIVLPKAVQDLLIPFTGETV
ncbi:site-specific integrase [Pseudoalteromonas arctica]|uniref:Site-specific integrase n=1 Tax=Pseudoalteromonas arctica TaxID=394751 RepID=A0A7Y0HAI1_9GAMM|nr:site-specific integrase [Pseudoalteromonas arctica]NMM40565.1 site-specific integrase [Pseudoalteromonas arctica]